MTSSIRQYPWGWVAGLGIYCGILSIAPRRAAIGMSAAPLLAALAGWVLGDPQRWIACFLAAAAVLPPLPIPLGDSGPHPSLLIVACGLVATGARRWSFPADGPTRALILLFFAMLLSIPAAAALSGPAIAAGSLARIFLFGITPLVFIAARAPDPASGAADFRTFRFLFAAGMVAALVACVDFYYQLPAPAGFAPQYVWLTGGVYRRAQGFFYEASTLGNFCAFFLTMILTALVRPLNIRIPKILLAAAAGLFATALLLSYSRGSLIALAVAAAMLFWTNRRRFRWARIAVWTLCAAAAAAGAAWRFFPQFAVLYWQRVQGSAQFFFSHTENVFSGRLESWRSLMSFLIDHPLYALIGVGYKTLPYSDIAGQPTVADNVYLGMLAETGMIGLLAIVILHAALLRAAYRAMQSQSPAAQFFGTGFFCFWTGEIVQMFSGDLLTYWRVLPLYLWTLAIAMRSADEAADPRSV